MLSKDQRSPLAQALTDLRELTTLDSDLPITPAIRAALCPHGPDEDRDRASRECIRSWLEGLGPSRDHNVGLVLRSAFAHYAARDAHALGLTPEQWRAVLQTRIGNRRRVLVRELPTTVASLRYQEDKAILDFAESQSVANDESTADGAASSCDDFEILSRECAFIFESGRVPAALIETCELIARATCDAYIARYAYTGGDDAAFVFTHCIGCDIDPEIAPAPLNYRLFPVRFGEPLQPGDRRRFTYTLNISGGVEPRPHYVIVPEHPTKSATIAVQFAPDAIPAAVYEFAGSSTNFERERHPIAVDASRCARAEFSTLRMGWTYGLSWEWE